MRGPSVPRKNGSETNLATYYELPGPTAIPETSPVSPRRLTGSK